MKMSREDIIRTRTVILAQMDAVIHCDIGDEAISESWLMCGVPDGWDVEDLNDIAADDDSWNEVVECFVRCCKRAGIITQ